MAKTVIIHFAPIELYPPVQNLIDELVRTKQRITVITTSQHKATIPRLSFDKNVEVKRFSKTGAHLSPLIRYVNYFLFYVASTLTLILTRPKVVMYFETLSSFPVYIYKRWVRRSTHVLIHYHEYSTLQQYEKGMVLERWFHRLEKYFYSVAIWVSHTNQVRMDKFLADVAPVKVSNPHILPVYPPRSWFRMPRRDFHTPVRFVYVGALSLDTMYVREFAEWVMQQNGRVVWSLYSLHYPEVVSKYFKDLGCPWIELKPGVSYADLPQVLSEFDIGVVLYKGHIPNYIFNAPNKLFEYLAMGLDVWFPEVMEGSKPYITEGSYPAVHAVEFSDPAALSDLLAMPRDSFKLLNSVYFYDQVIPPLIKKLLSHD